ncbi:hypothetical protein [uncultured Roseovarius sp.]|uniref:DUF6928 family protein n=1 Tax=uncultured Roseovarius sp. TaxID=293344 RepID=UPI00263923BE|nr:hypothetical protein [uncultured Roseovarius sp.]
MGAKAWFAAYFDGDPKVILSKKPELDRSASVALAEKMFAEHTIQEKEDGSLDLLNPEKSEAFIGVYGDLKIIAHEDFSGDLPSQVDQRWLTPDFGSTIYIHATHSVVDWFAFALWKDGQLTRSTSVSPDGGVHEDIGEKLPFELPYWDGAFSLEDEFEEDEAYPLPFHPLELSEAALLTTLGFQFEGHPDDWVCDPMEIPIMKFQISKKAWWKFW